MTDKQSRRVFLGSVAAGLAGLAGCSSLAETTNGNQSTSTNRTKTTSPTPGPTATIPDYPHAETAFPPLEAEPDPEVLNPVLTASHVTDVNARFVADPFLYVEDGNWHMFLEVQDGRGKIAHATSDDQGKTWTYDQVVLKRPYHISFPQVFKWQGEYYMTTEEGRDNPAARLYRATSFPKSWTQETVLYQPDGHSMTDHALFRWNDRWWSIVGGADGDTYLYHSDSLTGTWRPHERNPVVDKRPEASRPGGRPVVQDDRVLVYFQDLTPYYGHSVRAYEITDLSPTSYADSELDASPVVGPAKQNGQWNSTRMHQYDPWYLDDERGWRVAVDGDGSGDRSWAIGIYRVTP